MLRCCTRCQSTTATTAPPSSQHGASLVAHVGCTLLVLWTPCEAMLTNPDTMQGVASEPLAQNQTAHNSAHHPTGNLPTSQSVYMRPQVTRTHALTHKPRSTRPAAPQGAACLCLVLVCCCCCLACCCRGLLRCCCGLLCCCCSHLLCLILWCAVHCNHTLLLVVRQVSLAAGALQHIHTLVARHCTAHQQQWQHQTQGTVSVQCVSVL